MIIFSSQKSIPFWGDLTIWLYPKEWILLHSEGTWLCDYTFHAKIYPILRGTDYVITISSKKSIPFWGDLTVIVSYGMTSITFWGDLTMWLYFPAKNLSHSEGTWLYDCILRNEFYRILRGPEYVIILFSQNLSHSEGNWLCDYTFCSKIYPILRGTDFVIILSCQESIPFWGDLTMWS